MKPSASTLGVEIRLNNGFWDEWLCRRLELLFDLGQSARKLTQLMVGLKDELVALCHKLGVARLKLLIQVLGKHVLTFLCSCSGRGAVGDKPQVRQGGEQVRQRYAARP